MLRTWRVLASQERCVRMIPVEDSLASTLARRLHQRSRPVFRHELVVGGLLGQNIIYRDANERHGILCVEN